MAGPRARAAWALLALSVAPTATWASPDIIEQIAADALAVEAQVMLSIHGSAAEPRARELCERALAQDTWNVRALELMRELTKRDKASGTQAAALMPPPPSTPPPLATPSPTEQRAAPTEWHERIALANAKIEEAVRIQTFDVDSYTRTPHVIKLYEDALRTLPELAQVEPTLAASVYDNMAVALRAIDRIDEAIVAHRRATEISPAVARHHMNLAGTLYMQGDTAEAAKSCRVALELNPMHAKALNILNSVEPITDKSDPRLGLLRRHVAATAELTDEERTLSHFDLYRALDKLGRYDEAWEHLERGNELALQDMLARPNADGAGGAHVPSESDLESTVQLLSSVFRQEYVAEALRAAEGAWRAAGAPDSDAAWSAQAERTAPVFIVGAYRSGSTLIETILSSHSRVHGAGENTALAPAVAVAAQALADEGYPARGYPGIFFEAAAREPRAWERVGAHYMALMRESKTVQAAGKPRWADKNLGNSRLVGVISLAMPRARIVHTVRSPVATCFSMYTQHFTQGSAEGRWFTCRQRSLVAHYRAQHRMMKHWESVLPAGRMLTVRYEDVVAGQEELTRRIVAYSGLEWEDACLQFHKSKRSVATASLSQVRKRARARPPRASPRPLRAAPCAPSANARPRRGACLGVRRAPCRPRPRGAGAQAHLQLVARVVAAVRGPPADARRRAGGPGGRRLAERALAARGGRRAARCGGGGVIAAVVTIFQFAIRRVRVRTVLSAHSAGLMNASQLAARGNPSGTPRN